MIFLFQLRGHGLRLQLLVKIWRNANNDWIVGWTDLNSNWTSCTNKEQHISSSRNYMLNKLSSRTGFCSMTFWVICSYWATSRSNVLWCAIIIIIVVVWRASMTQHFLKPACLMCYNYHFEAKFEHWKTCFHHTHWARPHFNSSSSACFLLTRWRYRETWVLLKYV